MKVRWTEESVRFRITPTELETLRRGAAARSRLPIPGGWAAGIYPDQSATCLIAASEELRVLLTRADLTRLCQTESEGVYFQQTESGLRYYIEKDFPCEHPRPAEAGETSETFPRSV